MMKSIDSPLNWRAHNRLRRNFGCLSRKSARLRPSRARCGNQSSRAGQPTGRAGSFREPSRSQSHQLHSFRPRCRQLPAPSIALGFYSSDRREYSAASTTATRDRVTDVRFDEDEETSRVMVTVDGEADYVVHEMATEPEFWKFERPSSTLHRNVTWTPATSPVQSSWSAAIKLPPGDRVNIVVTLSDDVKDLLS